MWVPSDAGSRGGNVGNPVTQVRHLQTGKEARLSRSRRGRAALEMEAPYLISLYHYGTRRVQLETRFGTSRQDVGARRELAHYFWAADERGSTQIDDGKT